MAADGKKPAGGCGVLVMYGGVFRCRRRLWHRRSASTSSLPRCEQQLPLTADRRRTGSGSTTFLVPANVAGAPPTSRFAPNNAKSQGLNYHKAMRRPAGMSKASLANNGLSIELNGIHGHQRTKDSSMLIRASSGNVMVYGNLGNLQGNKTPACRDVLFDCLPKTAREMSIKPTVGNGFKPAKANAANMGNIRRNGAKEIEEPKPELCRSLSKRMDPEELKEMGNDEFKNGRYAEAVALYDRAISMDSKKAVYRSNKAAALIGLGQLLEAVHECKEAVKIDPSYCRAHHRLATIYLRLGEAEKAIQHYRLSRKEAEDHELLRARSLQALLAKCNDAQKIRDWHTVLKKAQSAASAGADSAPQVFALQAEALLKLGRHDEADTIFSAAPKFDIDASTKIFATALTAYFLSVQAQVDMAAGRFEQAIGIAQRAVQLDPSNREISAVARRTRAVSSARSKGNELFKVFKFAEACLAYGEGLDHDPRNAVLLCNRAACRSKLGHWEKAVEDCSTALLVRPSYSKARHRRADCNAKLERWDAARQDYEAYLCEIPGDEEVKKAMSDAQEQIKKREIAAKEKASVLNNDD